MVTVYVVEIVNAAVGVNVIWFDDALTVAATRLLPASLNWKVEPVTVEAFTASLKLATADVLVPKDVAPFCGDTDVTVGGVLSMAAQVVKLQVKLFTNAFPAKSLTPEAPPIIVTV